jgi:hypothetical protein
MLRGNRGALSQAQPAVLGGAGEGLGGLVVDAGDAGHDAPALAEEGVRPRVRRMTVRGMLWSSVGAHPQHGEAARGGPHLALRVDAWWCTSVTLVSGREVVPSPVAVTDWLQVSPTRSGKRSTTTGGVITQVGAVLRGRRRCPGAPAPCRWRGTPEEVVGAVEHRGVGGVGVLPAPPPPLGRDHLVEHGLVVACGGGVVPAPDALGEHPRGVHAVDGDPVAVEERTARSRPPRGELRAGDHPVVVGATPAIAWAGVNASGSTTSRRRRHRSPRTVIARDVGHHRVAGRGDISRGVHGRDVRARGAGVEEGEGEAAGRRDDMGSVFGGAAVGEIAYASRRSRSHCGGLQGRAPSTRGLPTTAPTWPPGT